MLAVVFAGSRARAQRSEIYQCVGGPLAGQTCDPTSTNPCQRCQGGPHPGGFCTVDSACGIGGSCRGVCESIPRNPVGGPERFTVFAEDDLWITTLSSPDGEELRLEGDFAELDTSVTAFTATSLGTDQSFATQAVPGNEPLQTRGRFVDPMRDRVLWMIKSKPASDALEYRVFSPRTSAPPTMAEVPPFSFPVPTGTVANRAALAAGDLDLRIGSDGFYHDESVIAYEEADHSITVAVLDYERRPGTAVVTKQSLRSIGRLSRFSGGGSAGAATSGSIAVGVGDVNGDLRDEIVVAWQASTAPVSPDGAKLVLTILRYDGSLTVLQPQVGFAADLSCPRRPDPPASRPSVDIAVADFRGEVTGELDEEIAISFLGDQAALDVELFVVGLDAKLRQDFCATLPGRGLVDAGEAVTLPADGSFRRGLVPRLAAGLFQPPAASGAGLSRRQLALLQWRVSELTFHPMITLYEVAEPSPGNGQILEFTRSELSPGTQVAGHCAGDPAQSCSTTFSCPGMCVPDLRATTVPPLSLAAGNFRGGDFEVLKRFPRWGVAAGHPRGFGESTTGFVTFLDFDSFGRLGPTLTFPDPVSTDATGKTLLATAYDRQGRSVYLGAPLIIVADQLIKLDVVAQEPPKHADWLPGPGRGQGAFVNVSRLAGLAVRLTDSDTTAYSTRTATTSDWTIGASSSVTVKESVTGGVKGVDGVTASSQYRLQVAGSYEEKKAQYEMRGTQYSFDVTEATSDDDLVGGSYRSMFLWRYPILGLTLPPSVATDHGYYEIVLPGAVRNFTPTGGLNFDFYQPRHENGNALSYLQISDTIDRAPVPLPDLGSYAFPGSSGVCNGGPLTCAGGMKAGQTCSSDGECPGSVCVGPTCKSDSDCQGPFTSCEAMPLERALFNQEYFVDSDTETVRLVIEDSAGGGSMRENTAMASESTDTQQSISATASDEVGTVRAGVKFDFAVNNSNSLSKLALSSHTTTSSSTFELQKNCDGSECNEASRAYRAAVAYYYTQDGAQKVAQAVDLQGSASGVQFWRQHYAGKPDPALNMPGRIVIVRNEQSGVKDVPQWSPSIARQRIRGFFVLHDDPANPQELGAPFARSVIAGDKIRLSVRVYNYSLDTRAENVEVLFLALPMSAADSSILGEAKPLCDASTAPQAEIGVCPKVTVQPLGMETAELSLDTSSLVPAGRNLQGYRLFVILDPNNRIPNEIHEWKDRFDRPPTIDGQPITDPLTGENEKLESGQNNQGFGSLVVYRRASPPTARGVDAGLGEGAVAIQIPTGELVTGYLTVPNERPVDVRVTLTADRTSPGRHVVLLYDGHPEEGGTLVATDSILGIDEQEGAHAWLQWLPKALGTRRLHALLLENADDPRQGNNLAELTVEVADSNP